MNAAWILFGFDFGWKYIAAFNNPLEAKNAMEHFRKDDPERDFKIEFKPIFFDAQTAIAEATP